MPGRLAEKNGHDKVEKKDEEEQDAAANEAGCKACPGHGGNGMPIGDGVGLHGAKAGRGFL